MPLINKNDQHPAISVDGWLGGEENKYIKLTFALDDLDLSKLYFRNHTSKITPNHHTMFGSD